MANQGTTIEKVPAGLVKYLFNATILGKTQVTAELIAKHTGGIDTIDRKTGMMVHHEMSRQTVYRWLKDFRLDPKSLDDPAIRPQTADYIKNYLANVLSFKQAMTLYEWARTASVLSRPSDPKRAKKRSSKKTAVKQAVKEAKALEQAKKAQLASQKRFGSMGQPSQQVTKPAKKDRLTIEGYSTITEYIGSHGKLVRKRGRKSFDYVEKMVNGGQATKENYLNVIMAMAQGKGDQLTGVEKTMYDALHGELGEQSRNFGKREVFTQLGIKVGDR